MYFDTHAHYDSDHFHADREEVVAGLPQKGISFAVCPGINLASSRDCIALAQRHEHIYAAVGIHPHDCALLPDDYILELEGLASKKKVVAIGEIGLDYHYDHSPRERQRDVLYAQMELAKRKGLPVILHNREAHADCLSAVQSFPGLSGVYHCYSGSLEDAKTILALGWYLSFTGIITFPNVRKAREVLRFMPLDRLMIETDAPYLTPVPYRGKRNDSGYLPLIAEEIARVRGICAEEIAHISTENAKRFFRLNHLEGVK